MNESIFIVSPNDLENLNLKYEFNSDNKRIYSGEFGTKILGEGEI